MRLQRASFEAHLLQRFQNRYWPIISKIGRARMIRGAGWSMLRDARGRRAIGRTARIAAFAVSAAAALWVASLAAEPAANGRLVGTGAGSGTMDEALIQSYQNNPQLNSQRSATRAIDENVPTALAGYRPRVRPRA